MAGMNVDEDDAGMPELPAGGPYLTSGNLKGYTWVALAGAGTTLTATGLAATEFSAPICIQGSVVATPDYSGNAIVGLNLNQAMSGEPMAFTPTLAGLQLALTSRVASPLRIQLQTADGAGLWCAELTGAGGFIPWTAFNTACWDGSGAAYASQPISIAMISVPGTTTAAVPYDFCLNSITEANAPAAPPPPIAGANPT
jgi:hypothetical protein